MRNSMIYIGKLLLQLAIVALSVSLGSYLADNYQLIPAWLLNLPQIDFSTADILTNIKVFLAFCGGAFLVGRLFLGWNVFSTARRTAQEVYVLIVGIVASSLYLFVFTTVNFSPELLLDTSIISILLFTISYLIFGVSERPGVGARLWAFITGFFGLIKKPAAWAVLVFALSPLIMARQFIADRDFANWITEKRISANISQDYPYQLKPLLPNASFLQPIMVRFAPGDDSTIYVLERSGSIYSTDYPAGTNKTLIVDQTDSVGYVEMENGALGFDFHPQFNAAGNNDYPFLYLYYTSYLEESQTNYLSRFDVSLPDPSSRTNSELKLITQHRNNSGYHNAGAVEFGPDGFLYLSVGEATAEHCHQRIDCSLVGGVLRLDVDETGGDVSHPPPRQPKDGISTNYYIPKDNPYVGQANALEEFWAHGLRNPFRISFDKQTGVLWAGDVGSTVWEEVNMIVKGGNYQFPYREGNVDTEIARPETIVGEEQAPIYTYAHTALLRSVIGGTVYRGSEFPELQGQYLFGDNYSGEIFSMPATGDQVEQVKRITRSPLVAQAGITSLVNGPNGEVLVTALGGLTKPSGLVFRLVGGDEEFSSAAVELASNTESEVGAAEAKSLFNTNCARCHGTGGAADGPDSQHLGTWVPDFTNSDFHKWRSDEEILIAIQKGGVAVGQSPAMPPWENILSQAEIIALRDYIRSFNQ